MNTAAYNAALTYIEAATTQGLADDTDARLEQIPALILALQSEYRELQARKKYTPLFM